MTASAETPPRSPAKHTDRVRRRIVTTKKRQARKPPPLLARSSELARKSGRACKPRPPLTKSTTLVTAGSTTAMTNVTLAMEKNGAKTTSKPNSSGRIEDRRRWSPSRTREDAHRHITGELIERKSQVRTREDAAIRPARNAPMETKYRKPCKPREPREDAVHCHVEKKRRAPAAKSPIETESQKRPEQVKIS